MEDQNIKTDSVSAGRILWDYVFRNKANRPFVVVGGILIVLQIVVFKYLYPFMGFINGDSYVYLETAYHNLSINTYPVGYSMFLRVFSVFTKSDTILFLFQYLLSIMSTLGLIFSLFYFYEPARVTKIILYAFIIINPVFLFLSNYVSSDAFFLGLSMIWFTQLLWISKYPSNRLIIINSIILVIAFTVRYNALFYPLIAIITIFMGNKRNWNKIGGICLSFLLIGLFIYNNSTQYLKLTGQRQFTPFTGWQTANNALYAYRYVDSAHLKDVPKKFSEIDNIVRTYFDSTRDIKKHPQEALVASTIYMWDPNSPLSIYSTKKFPLDSIPFKKWAKAAPMMAEYGKFLIQKYPSAYIKFYLVPNMLKYYAPPVEFLNTYSTGVDSVQLIAKVWFDYSSNKLTCRAKTYEVNILNFFPTLTGTMNTVMLLSIISFFFLNGHKTNKKLLFGMLLVVTLWLGNFCFSVLASPIALRFQLFPILTTFSYAVFLLEYIVKAAFSNKLSELNEKESQLIDHSHNTSMI